MDYRTAWRRFTGASRVLMTTHRKPDGDGLGSLAALAEALAPRGKRVRTVLPSPPPSTYDFLAEVDRFEVLGRDVRPEELPREWDLVAVLDTGTWQQLDTMAPWVEANAGRVLVVDHHVTRDDLQQAELADSGAAATGQIVFRMLRESGVAITPGMAEALFVAVASDTGWFRFPNVNPEVYRLAARLQELGADVPAIYQRLFQSATPEKMGLIREALGTLTLAFEGKVAHFEITREMFARAGAEPSDTENVIDECQRVRGVLVGILFVELDDVIRVGLRSKRDVDVAEIAAGFGGGGHARAAGCQLAMPLPEAKKAVLEAVGRALNQAPTGDS